MEIIEIYTDGASRGNGRDDAIGSWAFCILYKNVVSFENAGINSAYRTNNQNEMLAVIESLKQIQGVLPFDIQFYCDSELIVNSINQGWLVKWLKNNFKKSNKKPVENKDLWLAMTEQFVRLKQEGCKVTFNHVKGHAGDTWNEHVDYLCNYVLDNRIFNLQQHKERIGEGI